MSGFDPMGPLPLIAAEQCTARSKGTGQRCGRMVRGGGVCRYHGGKAPQVERQREARVAAAQAQAMFADTYEPRDSGEALAAAAQNADQVLRSLQQRIELAGELRAHDLEALGQWFERVSKLSKAVLDARIDERRAQLSEQQGALVALIIRAIFARLNLSPAQQAISSRVAVEVLRAANDGPAAIEAAGRAS
jgi:hypothetical protein